MCIVGNQKSRIKLQKLQQLFDVLVLRMFVCRFCHKFGQKPALKLKLKLKLQLLNHAIIILILQIDGCLRGFNATLKK